VRPLAAFCTLLSPFVPQLFMGEEYGEPAPFQFFSDHIDEEIATATREGRRREFAAFASFDQEVPDPEDPQTFARSKLTRQRDPDVTGLYVRLIEARRRLGANEAEDIEYSESMRWLRLRRGGFALACNFGSEPVELACGDAEVELATHAGVHLEAGYLKLPPMSGALTR
jgi:maltooligosyltrehalose trehalohydrolase